MYNIYICIYIYIISVYTYQETYRRSSKDGTIGQYLLGPLESLASDSPRQPLPIWTLLADHWKGYLTAITTCAELWNAAEIRKAQGNTTSNQSGPSKGTSLCSIWVCLKMLAKPHCTQWLKADHYPVMNNG